MCFHASKQSIVVLISVNNEIKFKVSSYYNAVYKLEMLYPDAVVIAIILDSCINNDSNLILCTGSKVSFG